MTKKTILKNPKKIKLKAIIEIANEIPSLRQPLKGNIVKLLSKK